MMAVVPIEPRSAVRRYVRDYIAQGSLHQYAITNTVLQRLEENPDKVYSGIARFKLKPPQLTLVIFYLIQSANLAESRIEVVKEASSRADEFNRFAQMARELADFCRGEISLNLALALPCIVAELEKQATHYAETPARLQINRKNRTESSGHLLALRHFYRRLVELGIDCSGDYRLAAVQWLVEAAMDYRFKDGQAAEAIRGVAPRVPM